MKKIRILGRGRNRTRDLIAGLVAALLAGANACAGENAEPRLWLEELVEIPLEDPDSAALGQVGGFARASDGSLLVSDRQRGALLVFAADGRREQAVGRRGSGPGEWEMGPYRLFWRDDTTLVASDGSRLLVGPVTAPGADWIRVQSALSPVVAVFDGRFVVRRMDAESRSSLASFSGSSDALQPGGPYPEHLGRSEVVDQMLIWPAVGATAGDSVAVLVSGSDFLFFGPFSGPYDSIPVPVVTRRGAMRALLDAVTDPESAMRAAYKASFPFAVHALPDGARVAMLWLDQEFLGDRMAGAMHLAVANIRSGAFCGEIALPGPSDPQMWATLRGDTLWSFAHEVDSLAGSSQPVVRAHRIRSSGC